LRIVDDGAGHGSNVDDGPTFASFDHVFGACLRGDETSGNIDINQATEFDQVVRLRFKVRTANISLVLIVRYGVFDSLRDTSGVDEDVHGAEMIHHVFDRLAYSIGIADVNLVETRVNPSLIAEVSCSLVPDLFLNVQYRDATDTNFGKCLCHVETKTAARAA
jgi:hypothetical protein